MTVTNMIFNDFFDFFLFFPEKVQESRGANTVKKNIELGLSPHTLLLFSPNCEDTFEYKCNMRERNIRVEVLHMRMFVLHCQC